MATLDDEDDQFCSFFSPKLDHIVQRCANNQSYNPVEQPDEEDNDDDDDEVHLHHASQVSR